MGAIVKKDGRIDFTYGYCIACGLCEKACPEGALKLERTLDFAKLVDLKESALIESESVKCKKCGKPFITKAALDQMSNIMKKAGGTAQFRLEEQLELLEYCNDCRAVLALEKVLGST